MLEAVTALLVGLLLLAHLMRGQFICPLLPLQAVIGVVALVAGPLNLARFRTGLGFIILLLGVAALFF